MKLKKKIFWIKKCFWLMRIKFQVITELTKRENNTFKAQKKMGKYKLQMKSNN